MNHVYYMAANSYEGCGHRHRTAAAARRCLPKHRVTRRERSIKIYRMDCRGRRSQHRHTVVP